MQFAGVSLDGPEFYATVQEFIDKINARINRELSKYDQSVISYCDQRAKESQVCIAPCAIKGSEASLNQGDMSAVPNPVSVESGAAGDCRPLSEALPSA